MEVDPELSIGRHASRASRVEQHDEEELAEFGYKQELRRDWGLMHNFGISFSIIVSCSCLEIGIWVLRFLDMEYNITEEDDDQI